MKTFLWITIAIIACILALFVLRTVKEKPKVSCRDIEPAPSILAFGDSLVAGYGATTKGGFVTLVSNETGVPIQNLGQGGDTSESAKKRLPVAVARKPDVVLVLLGGNDALRRTPVETTQANLDTIIASFKEGGAEVVLLGVLGGLPFQDPYPAMFESLAEKRDAIYVPNVLSGLIGKQEFMSDSIHPNEAGYARIAKRVLPAVEEACAKR
ncbi:MAG TPA: GDSL-type esterase/lipase family protein [Candidatus Paceibacterota bacterium]|jgi:lysophospholipase L1-like esterase